MSASIASPVVDTVDIAVVDSSIVAPSSSASPSSSTVHHIILYYLYTSVSPRLLPLVHAWQHALCVKLGLLGRIRLATEGVNGTLSGTECAITEYIRHMNDAEVSDVMRDAMDNANNASPSASSSSSSSSALSSSSSSSSPSTSSSSASFASSDLLHLCGLFSGIAYKHSSCSDLLPFPALYIARVPELTASGDMARSCKVATKHDGSVGLVEVRAKTRRVRPTERRQPEVATNKQNGDEVKDDTSISADSSSSPASSPSVVDPSTTSSSASSSSSPPVDAAGSTPSPAPAASAAASTLHLSPSEFHAALANFDPSTTLLLDLRNSYESAVGLFTHATDPKLRSFAQFPSYVDQNLEQLGAKTNILMYCTGGVRCEKASIYLSQRTGAKVQQLQGGIHCYLEQYPDGGLFRGKNFVFDARLAMGAATPALGGPGSEVVGRCVHCAAPSERLTVDILCRVCVSHVIVCESCEQVYKEKDWRYYCAEHMLLAAAKGGAKAVEVTKDSVQEERDEKEDDEEDEVEDHPLSIAPSPSPSPSPSPPSSSSSSSSPAPPQNWRPRSGLYTASLASASAWTPPSSDLGCPEQVASFLSRFSIARIESMINEFDRILAYYDDTKKTRKKRTVNRQVNIKLQRDILAEYANERRRRTEGNGSEEQKDELSSLSASSSSPPPLMSYSPFLNV